MSYTSTAITAQGSKLEIETGSGGAESCSAIALGNPTILTSNAHALTNGDVVTCAAFTGADAASINALTFTVTHVTTNTFAINLNSAALTITVGSGTATPVALTEIKEIKTFSGFDGEASEYDKSHLNSAAKEFGIGLRDYGGFSADISYLTGDSGQTALRTSAGASTLKSYKLTLSNAATATFSAYAKQIPISGGVDKAVDGSFKLKITGVVTWG